MWVCFISICSSVNRWMNVWIVDERCEIVSLNSDICFIRKYVRIHVTISDSTNRSHLPQHLPMQKRATFFCFFLVFHSVSSFGIGSVLCHGLEAREMKETKSVENVWEFRYAEEKEIIWSSNETTTANSCCIRIPSKPINWYLRNIRGNPNKWRQIFAISSHPLLSLFHTLLLDIHLIAFVFNFSYFILCICSILCVCRLNTAVCVKMEISHTHTAQALPNWKWLTFACERLFEGNLFISPNQHEIYWSEKSKVNDENHWSIVNQISIAVDQTVPHTHREPLIASSTRNFCLRWTNSPKHYVVHLQ